MRRPRVRRPRTAARAPLAAAPDPRRSRPARQLRGQRRARAVVALDAERAAVRGDAVGETTQAGAGGGRGAARAVIFDGDNKLPVFASGTEDDPGRIRVLDGVGETFTGDEVGGALEATVEPLARNLHLDRHRRATGKLAERRAQAGVELGGRKAMRELAQLVDRERDLGERTVERVTGALWRRRAELVLGVAQREPDRDESLLGAIVKVALDPAALGVAGGDDPGPRSLDLGQLAADLDAQSGDLDRQPAGLDNPGQEVALLRDRWVEEHDAERLAAALDRDSLPPVVWKVGGGHPA